VTAPLLLVVEDDAEVRDAISDVLRDAGYRISAAGDGAAAIRALRAGLKPAAILLDLMMPEMNGYEFRTEQRADPAIADIPVIVISAMRIGERAAAALAAAACIPKPSPVDDLLATVSRVARPVS
jgi:two-component system, chemotaxis family, chemotaxis protein CheY